jgi:hypothetical protein
MKQMHGDHGCTFFGSADLYAATSSRDGSLEKYSGMKMQFGDGWYSPAVWKQHNSHNLAKQRNDLIMLHLQF